MLIDFVTPFLFQALHYKKYSTASDVWSFGVVMYEIWSVGHKPFENDNNSKVSIPLLICSSLRATENSDKVIDLFSLQ